jgi:hypothetical protein
MDLIDTLPRRRISSASGKYRVDLSGAQGVQVGDHNIQTNTFATPPRGPTDMPCRPLVGANSEGTVTYPILWRDWRGYGAPSSLAGSGRTYQR